MPLHLAVDLTKELSQSWNEASEENVQYVHLECSGTLLAIPQNFCRDIGLYNNLCQTTETANTLPLGEQVSLYHTQRLLEAEALRFRTPFGQLATVKPILGNHWTRAIPSWWKVWLASTFDGDKTALPQQHIAHLISAANYLQMAVLKDVLSAELAQLPWEQKVFSILCGSVDMLGVVVACKPGVLDSIKEAHGETISVDEISNRAAVICDVGRPWITLPLKANRKNVDLLLPDPSSQRKQKNKQTSTADDDEDCGSLHLLQVLKEFTSLAVEILLNQNTTTTTTTNYNNNNKNKNLTATELWWLYGLCYSLCTENKLAKHGVNAAGQAATYLKEVLTQAARTIIDRTDLTNDAGKQEFSLQYKRVVYPLQQVYGYLEDYYFKHNEGGATILTLAAKAAADALTVPLISMQNMFTPVTGRPTDTTTLPTNDNPTTTNTGSGKQLGDVLAVLLDQNYETLIIPSTVWRQIPLFEEQFNSLQSTWVDVQEGPFVVGMGGLFETSIQEIIKFLDYHSTQPLPVLEKPLRGKLEDLLDEWDRNWVYGTLIKNGDEKQHELLIDCMMTANRLRVPSVVEICGAAVASMIKGKTPIQIRELFNIENDFTPEEEEKIREENRWCEEA